MFASSTSALAAAGVVVTILGFAGVVVTGMFFSSRAKGTAGANEELGKTVTNLENLLRIERNERERSERECEKNISKLTGQVETLQRQQVDSLLSKVAEATTAMVDATLGRLEDGLKAAVAEAVSQGVAAGIKAAHDAK